MRQNNAEFVYLAPGTGETKRLFSRSKKKIAKRRIWHEFLSEEKINIVPYYEPL